MQTSQQEIDWGTKEAQIITPYNLCFSISCELRLPSPETLEAVAGSAVTYTALSEGPSCPTQESSLLPKHTASGGMHMHQ